MQELVEEIFSGNDIHQYVFISLSCIDQQRRSVASEHRSLGYSHRTLIDTIMSR